MSHVTQLLFYSLITLCSHCRRNSGGRYRERKRPRECHRLSAPEGQTVCNPPFPAHRWSAGRPDSRLGIWTWCPPGPASPPCPSAGSALQAAALWAAYPAACSSVCCTLTWCKHCLEVDTHMEKYRLDSVFTRKKSKGAGNVCFPAWMPTLCFLI